MHMRPNHRAGKNACVVAGLKLAALLAAAMACHGADQTHNTKRDASAAAQFHKEIQPILQEYCYDCHGDGAKKGGVAFDELKSNDAVLNSDLWLNALKYLRAGLMPPRAKPHPSAEEQQKIEHWIKYGAFGIDPKNPDPGRVTVRRLNRVEYRSTIHDLMGIDFNAEVEFPPDDTGYGFDDIGDVLTVSPMLLEKYLSAAKDIVSEAVPTVRRVVAERTVAGSQFHRTDGKEGDEGRPSSLSYYEPGSVGATLTIDHAGSYHVTLDLAVKGEFEYDPGRCRAIFKLDGRELLRKEFGWYDNKTFHFNFDEKWEAGDRRMTLELEPLTPVDQKLNSLYLRVAQVTVLGPMEKEHWVHPKNYERFFAKEPPENPAAQKAYAHEVLAAFTTKAFRRPVDKATVDRLANLAESVYKQPGKNVETGIAHAMTAVLASPRFLFRLEEPVAGNFAAAAPVDEYSLASRLSYFLWSAMPDEELMSLARRGELRKNLAAQAKRMLTDERSEKMIDNFAGQWLQTRDVEGISINERAILARDAGKEKELREQIEAFRARAAERAKERASRAAMTNQVSLTNRLAGAVTNGFAQTNSAASTNALARRRGFGNFRVNLPNINLDRDLRAAMRTETEMFFATIVHEDRPVTDLIESDYTFLNRKLANLYGITNVTGVQMRRVSLPPDSPRGGVLTEGSMLVVTSNPDRTSPVKRGQFILENFLDMPAPPPPPNIPALEVTEKDIKDHEPTLRESLQQHRDKPLCASCHARMDPIGLAFENFNAMGMWRDKERNQTIDPAGKLVTGETFNGARELKHILATEHRQEFYRCIAGKLLTYASGRGLEYYDVETIDDIVARMDRNDGRFSSLLMGVIESAPFQKMRMQATAATADADDMTNQRPPAKQVAQNR